MNPKILILIIVLLIFSTITYANNIFKQESLEAYWKMDELSGDRVDSHGVYHLSPYEGDPASGTGKFGNAINFKKTKAKLIHNTVPTNMKININNFAISCWVNIGNNSDGSLVLKGGSPAILKLESRNNEHYPRFSVKDYYGNQFVQGMNEYPIIQGKWHHIVAISNYFQPPIGQHLWGMYLFLDGQRDQYQNDFVNRPDNYRDYVVFGASSYMDLTFNGSLDECALWNNILFTSTSEINEFAQNLYNQGNGVTYEEIVDYNCGDGFQRSIEECDDGNNLDGDGCSSKCKEECGPCPQYSSPPPGWCSEGVIVPRGPDECGCARPASCEAIVCGDELQQGNEECDDGNTNNNDGCSSTCKLERCGDNIVQSSEDCDYGDFNSNEVCRSRPEYFCTYCTTDCKEGININRPRILSDFNGWVQNSNTQIISITTNIENNN